MCVYIYIYISGRRTWGGTGHQRVRWPNETNVHPAVQNTGLEETERRRSTSQQLETQSGCHPADEPVTCRIQTQ